jgi:hypothetical protein
MLVPSETQASRLIKWFNIVFFKEANKKVKELRDHVICGSCKIVHDEFPHLAVPSFDDVLFCRDTARHLFRRDKLHGDIENSDDSFRQLSISTFESLREYANGAIAPRHPVDTLAKYRIKAMQIAAQVRHNSQQLTGIFA